MADTKIEYKGTNVCVVTTSGIAAGWEQWVMLRSDAHHDSVHCDRTLERQNLERAKERGAYILDAGDLFDAMQGKDDRRRSYDNLRPEYNVKDYFGEIARDAAKFYAPYQDNWLLFGRGNHEQAVLQKVGIDLTSNVCYALKQEHGAQYARAGGYGGYVRFVFHANGRGLGSCNLKYFHGSGGGGVVTKSMINAQRQQGMYPDANIIWNGHFHEGWVHPQPVERLSDKGVVYTALQWHVRTPGYKDEYGDGSDGWVVEGGMQPKPRGCAWVRFGYLDNKITTEVYPQVV